MKRHVFRLAVLSIIASLAFVTPHSRSSTQARAATAAPPQEIASAPVVITSAAADGLELISPASPSFDSEVRRLLPSGAVTPALGLKPYIVVLSNRSGRTIVAYAIIWKATYRDKRTDTETVQVKYPDALAGIADTGAVAFKDREDRPIPNGEQRAVAKEFEFGPPDEKVYWRNWLRQVGQEQKPEIAELEEIQISLDAAIFSDGLLVGPDSSNLDRDFVLYLEGKQRLFQQVVSNLDAGRTVEEAFQPVNSILDAGHPAPSRDRSALYEFMAAQEVAGLRKRIGDSAVAVTFRQAIRKEPFAIRRNSPE